MFCYASLKLETCYLQILKAKSRQGEYGEGGGCMTPLIGEPIFFFSEIS